MNEPRTGRVLYELIAVAEPFGQVRWLYHDEMSKWKLMWTMWVVVGTGETGHVFSRFE